MPVDLATPQEQSIGEHAFTFTLLVVVFSLLVLRMPRVLVAIVNAHCCLQGPVDVYNFRFH